jgi:monofunctional biosynthetic peptidoglycan transglycosylase
MHRTIGIEPDPLAAWTSVNDAVMGGVSTGAATRAPGGAILFSGSVSFENNGGFASARRPLMGETMPEFEAFRLRVAGDGRRYKLAAYTESGASGFAYQAGFTTLAGGSQVLELPLADFEARFRGRAVGNAPPLRSRSIRAVGFVIADRQEGPFRLLVAAIEALVSAA